MKKNRKFVTPPTDIGPGPQVVPPAPAPQVVAQLVLTIPDYGTRFGVSRDIVYHWIKTGIPHLRLSRSNIKIPIVEGDAWVKQNFLRQRES